MIEVCSRWLCTKNASLMHWLFYIFGQANNINIAPSPCIFGIGIGKILKIYMQLAFEALAPANPHMSEEEEKSNQEPRFVIGFYEGKIDSHYDLISCSNLKETKTKEKRFRLLGESEKNRILLQKSIGDRMDQQKQQDSLSLKRTIFFVIFNKVSHQLYIIFQALCRQELKDPSNKSSYSDDQWMKWHNDQKALLAYMFFLEFELCNANEFKNFLFPAGSLEKKEQINILMLNGKNITSLGFDAKQICDWFSAYFMFFLRMTLSEKRISRSKYFLLNWENTKPPGCKNYFSTFFVKYIFQHFQHALRPKPWTHQRIRTSCKNS